ncbi:hypothetical protein [Floccifex sp.]|nr:hypothetical protein [Floccifex sp.]MDD7280518.1 hypothetical protein [Erysipelotrichaceae bacterium]MDY2958529.1 hypothetical protein [Floccifex sp.]
MKRIITSFYQNPPTETREADWPDYNYGGWMDTIKDPSKKTKSN